MTTSLVSLLDTLDGNCPRHFRTLFVPQSPRDGKGFVEELYGGGEKRPERVKLGERQAPTHAPARYPLGDTCLYVFPFWGVLARLGFEI